MPSNRELMRSLEVSQTTVTTAMRELVARGILIRRHGRPLEVAPTHQQDRGTVAVVIPATPLRYYFDIIDGLEGQLSDMGYQLSVVYQRQFFSADSWQLFERLGHLNLRAVVLTVLEDVAAILDFRQRCPGVAVMLMDSAIDGPVHEAISDNAEGGRLVGRHLMEQGCRRLLYIGSWEGPAYTCEERLRGLRAAWRDANRNPDDIRVIQSSNTRERARLMIGERLDKDGLDFDGVFAYMDLAAAGACDALLDRGIRIPEQVKVAGFSNLAELHDCPVPLTSVEQHVRELASHGARELVLAMESPEPRLVRLLRPVTLVARRSTTMNAAATHTPFDVPETAAVLT